MQMTHGMVLAEVMQGGPAWQRAHDLVDDSMQPDDQKERLHLRVDECFATLEAAGLIERTQRGGGSERKRFLKRLHTHL